MTYLRRLNTKLFNAELVWNWGQPLVQPLKLHILQVKVLPVSPWQRTDILDRKMGNTLYWSHPWHDPFGLPMKVPSTMSPQEEMSGKRSFYPVQIMRSSSRIFGMPFTSMALSFMLSFSWQTLSPHRGDPEGESQPFHARPQ